MNDWKNITDYGDAEPVKLFILHFTSLPLLASKGVALTLTLIFVFVSSAYLIFGPFFNDNLAHSVK